MSKLYKEIDHLVREQVISKETADTIRAYYEHNQSSKSTILKVLFGVLGSLLIGSGIILLLAHNWDEISKYYKIIIGCLPLLLGHSLGFYVLRNKKNKAWKESAALLLFFSIGIAIAITSQVYHIEGNLYQYLLTWMLLGIPLIYLFQSDAITVVLLFINTMYLLRFDISNQVWLHELVRYIIVLGTIIPYYIQVIKSKTDRMIPVYNWLVPISISVVLIQVCIREFQGDSLLYLMLFFGVFYSLGTLWKITNNSRILKNGFLVIGSIGVLSILMMTTYKEGWQLAVDYEQLNAILLIALMLVYMGILVYQWIILKDIKYTLLQLTPLVFSIWISFLHQYEIIGVMFMNLWGILVGIQMIYKGIQTRHYGILNFGMLTIILLITLRFFDFDINFTTKGITFIILGIGFFIVNYRMSTLKKKEK